MWRSWGGAALATDVKIMKGDLNCSASARADHYNNIRTNPTITHPLPPTQSTDSKTNFSNGSRLRRNVAIHPKVPRPQLDWSPFV